MTTSSVDDQKELTKMLQAIYKHIKPNRQKIANQVRVQLSQTAHNIKSGNRKISNPTFISLVDSFIHDLAALDKVMENGKFAVVHRKFRQLLEKKMDVTLPYDAYLAILNQFKISIEDSCIKTLSKKQQLEAGKYIDHLWVMTSVDIMAVYVKLAEEIIDDKNAESALLFHTTKSLSIDLNLESLLNKVVFHGSMLLKSKQMFLFVPEKLHEGTSDTRKLILRASNQLGDTYGEYSLQFGEGIIGKVAEDRRPMVDNHYQKQTKKIVFLQNAVRVMAVPIAFNDELLGVLVAAEQNKSEHFTNVEQELLYMFAQQIAVVFKNVLLYHEQSKNADELETKNKMLEAQSDLILRKTSQLVVLNEVAQKTNASLELNEVLELVTNLSAESIGVNRCVLWIVDEKDNQLIASSAYGFTKEKLDDLNLHLSDIKGTALFKIIHDPEAMMITSSSEKKLFKTLLKNHLTADNSLLVPLVIKDQTIGFILVNDTREDHEFLGDEIALISAIVNQTVMAVENARLYQKMKEQAITDGMTGLYNHRYFQLRLTDEYNHASRYGVPLSLIMLDIDYFKKYNDTYGHMAGDLVLKEIAGLVKATVRQNDLVARYGGEEFVIIMPMTNRVGAEVVAERIRASVEECLFLGDINTPQVSMSVSIGVSSIETKNKILCSRENLIKQADSALYVAKEQGRNRVIMADITNEDGVNVCS